MAKRSFSSSSTPTPVVVLKTPAAAAPVTSEVAASTPVRKTVVPKKATPPGKAAPAPITYDLIAERAYHIWRSGTGGSEADNWFRAEMELKNETGL